MRFHLLLIRGVALASIGLAAACHVGETRPLPAPTGAATTTTTTNASATPPAAADSQPARPAGGPIRLVDFANFTYPSAPDAAAGDTFTLSGGRFAGDDRHDPALLAYLNYGDVTGDGAEEALVALSIGSGGSAIPSVLYIYTLDKERPKLLWAFETGDRGEGGLRQVYAEDGGLVVELYGDTKLVGKDFYGDGVGACCPKVFTRALYRWQRNGFRQTGKEEVLSNPSGGAPVVMPRHQSSH